MIWEIGLGVKGSLCSYDGRQGLIEKQEAAESPYMGSAREKIGVHLELTMNDHTTVDVVGRIGI
jgi:hypothetical protein